MTDTTDAISTTVLRVYRLLMRPRAARLKLEGTAPSDSAPEAERVVSFAIAVALEAGLAQTLEGVLAALKDLRGAEAEAWLRRQLADLEQ